jgi:hypothetical protein
MDVLVEVADGIEGMEGDRERRHALHGIDGGGAGDDRLLQPSQVPGAKGKVVIHDQPPRSPRRDFQAEVPTGGNPEIVPWLDDARLVHPVDLGRDHHVTVVDDDDLVDRAVDRGQHRIQQFGLGEDGNDDDRNAHGNARW